MMNSAQCRCLARVLVPSNSIKMWVLNWEDVRTQLIELIEAECDYDNPTALGGFNIQSKATGD